MGWISLGLAELTASPRRSLTYGRREGASSQRLRWRERRGIGSRIPANELDRLPTGKEQIPRFRPFRTASKPNVQATKHCSRFSAYCKSIPVPTHLTSLLELRRTSQAAHVAATRWVRSRTEVHATRCPWQIASRGRASEQTASVRWRARLVARAKERWAT